MAFIKGQPFIPQFTDPATGNLMSSGTVEFYLTGTSTPTNYYTDSAGTSGGTSLTLDSGGKTPTDVFFDTTVTYKIVVKNSGGTTLDTIDPFAVVDTSATFDTNLRTDLTTATATKGSDLVDYVDTLGTTYVKTLSDIINGDQVSIFRFIDPTKHAAIQALTNTDDLRSMIQDGIDSGAKHLYFPYGEYFVEITPSQNYCLLANSIDDLLISGPGRLYMTDQTDKQILRATSCTDLRLFGTQFRGPGNTGADGAQGLFQAVGCTNISLVGCKVYDADADGIAVATSTGVRLLDIYSNNCKKAALYVNQSTAVEIGYCHVTGFGGHLVSSAVVGGGIVSSSNKDAVIGVNNVWSGTGQGIVVNAVATADPPRNNKVLGNTVRDVANATNLGVSSGIVGLNSETTFDCANTYQDNTVQGCGRYNYEISNQNGIKICANTSIESDRAGFVISSCDDVDYYDNTAYNSDTSNTSASTQQYAHWFINTCTNVRGRRNRAEATNDYATSYADHSVRDDTGNTLDIFDQGRVHNLTSDKTLTDADFDIEGKYYANNEGASGVVTVTLPSATTARRNYVVELTRVASHNFRLDVNGTEQFRGETAGKYTQLESDGAVLQVKTVTSNIWEKLIETGTQTIEP